MKNKFYQKIQPWVIWGLGAAFFFTEYFARVDPSVIIPELMKSFKVGAFAVGNLSAFFYYPYVVMQIPVGLLIDRFGVRRLLICSSFLCAAAAYLFAVSQNLPMAETGRFFIGLSASFAFVSTLKLATIWFEPRRLGLLAGLTQGMGMLGAAVGEGVFAYSVAAFGWRYTIAIIGSILLVVAVLITLLVKDKRPGSTSISSHNKELAQSGNILTGLLGVLCNWHCWPNAIYAGLIYAPTAALAELWGPSFFHRTYQIPATEAALIVSTIFIGLAVGGPMVGWLSDKIGRRKPIMFLSAFFSFIFLTIALYVPNLPTPLLFILMFLYGFSNVGVAISYAVAGELVSQSSSGVSIAFTNMCSILVGGALLQPIIGWLLQRNWNGKIVNNIPIYSIQDYRSAVLILPIVLAVAFVCVIFIKETYCCRRIQQNDWNTKK